jgi:hypothetical protein
MSEVSAEKQRAFQRLADVVKALREQDRKTRSAGLKPILRALYLPEGGFDENRLGFVSFRAFLNAAADAGYVSIVPAAVGPDVDVHPRGSSAPSGGAAVSSNRIRGDLWTAFIDWRPEWLRVYDRESGRIGWLRARGGNGETVASESLRRHVEADPIKYVSITPVGQEGMLRWMRDFAASEDAEPARPALTTALSNPAPIRAFVLAIRQAGLHEIWNRKRLEKARGHILAWAADNKLDVDLDTEHELLSAPRLVDPSSARTGVPTMPDASSDELRERVVAAIRKMSRAELLRLAIPLEYFLGSAGG